jgi:hypothetical protein
MRAGRRSRNSHNSAASTPAMAAGHGQKHRIEFQHRQARGRQRAAEDHHADKTVDPAAGFFQAGLTGFEVRSIQVTLRGRVAE